MSEPRPQPARVLALGVGCERGCGAAELAELAEAALAEAMLAEAMLAEAGLATGALAAIVSIDRKRGEPAILALATARGVPARFFSAARLLAETARLSDPSAASFRATGCWGVAEGAALAACGPDGILVVPKRRSRRATCAVARAAASIDAAALAWRGAG